MISNAHQVIAAIQASSLPEDKGQLLIDAVNETVPATVRGDEVALSAQQIITVIVTLAGIFFANNPTAQEAEAFLLAIAQFIGPGAPTSGSIPAFSVGNTTWGPVPFAPKA
jgi:hypothetical protein